MFIIINIKYINKYTIFYKDVAIDKKTEDPCPFDCINKYV